MGVFLMCLSLVRVLSVLGLQWKSLQRLLFLPSQDIYLGNSSPWTEGVAKMSSGLVQQLGGLLGPVAKENCSPKYRSFEPEGSEYGGLRR